MICRYGAFGDVVHCSHLPRLIKKHYGIDHLTFETNYQGIQILNHNPFIDKLTVVDPMKWSFGILQKRWEFFEDEYDYFFNLFHSIEYGCIAMEDEQSYYRNKEYRINRYGKECFYDHATKLCGLPDEYLGSRGEMFYPENDHKGAKDWIEATKQKYGVKYILLVTLSGSSLHKKFIQAESVSRKILEKYPDTLIITTGDSCCKKQDFTGDRVISKVANWNFRTAALMAKYVDMYIGPNTGLSCVANMWDTPTIQLFTADSMVTHSMYAKNAFGVQSPIYCSPCHKGPYKYLGCPIKDNHPACIFYNEDEIMAKVEEVRNVCLPRIA